MVGCIVGVVAGGIDLAWVVRHGLGDCVDLWMGRGELAHEVILEHTEESLV